MNRENALKRLIEYGMPKDKAEELIRKAENKNCEPTSRLRSDTDTTIEFSAGVWDGKYGLGVTVYYYPQESEIEAAGEDLGNVNWVIEEYETY